MERQEFELSIYDENLKIFAKQVEGLQKLQHELLEVSKPFDEQMAPIKVARSDAMAPLIEQIETVSKSIVEVKQILEHHWEDQPKTVEIGNVLVQRRDLKRLEVVDNTLLIQELTRLQKLPSAIKKWDESFILKLCEVDVIPAGAAKVTIKKSISGRLIEKK